ncbi:MAG: hypothetical protein WD845_11655 [Pirellulales bacterium]
MNDDISLGLKILVERAVRPVVAPRARKKAMREELLAHVSEVYADEFATHGDAVKALVSTGARFGAPHPLTADLQRTVSVWQRAGLVSERFDWTQGAPLRSLVWRHSLVGLASMVAMFFVILPGVLLDGRRLTLDFGVRVAIMQGVFVGAFGCLMGGLSPVLGEALFGTQRQRSWRRAAGCMLGAAVFLPLFAFLFYWGLSGDLRASVDYFLFGCWFAPVFPLLCALISRQVHLERCYEREWSELDLGE